MVEDSIIDLEAVEASLQSQAKKLGLEIVPCMHDACMQHTWLYLPVHIRGNLDLYNNSWALVELEEDWNEQKPPPSVRLMLIAARGRIKGI